METEVAADASFDYVIFRILPENRYKACIASSEKEESVGHGPLDQLLEHLPSIKDQIGKGCLDNFELELPNTNDHKWFTKTTLTRLLHIIGSSDLKNAMAIGNEMSQLEEARKFHLSLYTQAEGITSSDTSKNELLRAMDSRLAALAKDLTSAFNLSAGAAVSFQELMDLQNCCQYFGDVKTRNLISKLTERNQKSQMEGSLDKAKLSVPFISKADFMSKSVGNPQVSNSVKAVKYNASPAKAAELERESSTESDESSFSSEDDQPAAERSRTMARSASPRRSASPMRKVQIGRSGSRRTPALAIRSIPYFPPRERFPSHKDLGNDSDVEVVEEPNKKTEVNVTRISVQDAISLFERKQKDDIVDSQKKSINDSSVNLNKAVLRRWSSGMGESQKSLTSENEVNSFKEDTHMQAESIHDMDRISENLEVENTIEDEASNGNVKTEPGLDVDDVQESQRDENGVKLDSVEWTRQKEAELNQMLMKFAQYNLSNPKNTELDKIKNIGSGLPEKAGFNGHQKEGKDEKLKGETTGKKVEKQAGQARKKKVLDKPKVEKSSDKVHTNSRIPKVNTTSKALNVIKNTPSLTSKRESPKLDVVKRASSKPSPLPATRKSWPSTPAPRTITSASAKISTGPSSGSLASRQKSQPPAPGQKPSSLAPRQKLPSPAPISRSSPKLEKTRPQQKDIIKVEVDTKKNSRKVDDTKKNRLPSKNGITSKTKTAIALEEEVAVRPVKAVVRKKGTKKSSVVPVEAKPPSRKVPGSTPVSSPLKNTEISIHAEQTMSEFENPVSPLPENFETITTDNAHPLETVLTSDTRENDLELEIELEHEKPNDGNEQPISIEAHVQDDEPTIQEPVISPAAWEESNQEDSTIPVGNGSSPDPVNPDEEGSSGTRVRHSLSQMLLEESSEPDIIEWGNAENPPTMICQKDAPKGLKRLLKFTRKNRGETNGSTWASPYTSEGEDDSEEHRSLGKRHSDNLLKIALHSKNHGEGFPSDSEPHSARSNASNSSIRSSSKFQDGQTTKGTRSFFSLSAFRGNKS